MKSKILLLIVFILPAFLTACGGMSAQTQQTKNCPDMQSVVESFYAANDASEFETSMQYLTDDIALVTWAEGANGHHLSANFAVGKNQIVDFLDKPGLKRTSSSPDLPNFTIENVQFPKGR